MAGMKKSWIRNAVGYYKHKKECKCCFCLRKGSGISSTPYHKKNCKCFVCDKKTDNEHHCWKGDNIGIRGIHNWVQRKLGKPMVCWSCGTDDEKEYEWANLSGEYKRSNGLKDWMRLCMKCHRTLDAINQVKGEKSKNAKFKNKDILKIRKLYFDNKFNMRQLAKKYNVVHSTIFCIIYRRTWKHI